MIKSTLTIAFLVLTCAYSFGQEDIQKHDTLELRVRLITNLDSIRLPAYCGIVAWNMTFEFEVIEVLSGNYPEMTIDINILCPRESVQSKRIETGKEYQYRLVKNYGFREIKVGGTHEEVELDDYKIAY